MAEKLAVADILEPQKQGYLLKRSDVVKTWRRRYFLLKDSKLFYYLTTNDESPRGTLELEFAVIRDVSQRINRPNTFEIAVNEQSYFLSAETASETKAWISKLRNAAEPILLIRKLPKSPREGVISLHISGLMCLRCRHRVEDIVAKFPGVESWKLTSELDQVQLTRTASLDLEGLLKLLEDAGYFPSIIQ